MRSHAGPGGKIRGGSTISLLLAAVLTQSGCATSGLPQNPANSAMTTSSTQGTTLVRTGQVTAIRDITTTGAGSPGGSLAGGLLGGLLGGQIGGGTGSAVAAVGGAIAGGIAGNEIGRAAGKERLTEITVQFTEGDVLAYRLASVETLQIGDRVAVTTTNRDVRITRAP
jgi:outer membrane lipoprotein SlyB